jgi:PPOX class probable F420-dependent enzyme
VTADHEELLRTAANAIVATIQPDGRPQLTPNWYLWDGQAFWISTLDWTVKVRNVRRDTRVTLCIDSGVRRGNYVQVFGTCELVEGDVREQTLELIRKYVPEEEEAQAHWRSIAPDRVLMRIVPERWQWRYD